MGKLDINSAIDLTKNIENIALTPSSCSGNACDKINLRALFNSSGTLKGMEVLNIGSKTIDITIWWSDPFGYCGSGSSDSIFPNRTVTLNTPSAYNPSYCSIEAKFQ